MKFINPKFLIMYAIIYCVTLFYLRDFPWRKDGLIGWYSDDDDYPFGVAYSVESGNILLNLDGQYSRCVHDGSFRAYRETPRVFYHLLHDTVGDYLDSRLK